jgi:ABC-type nitrate/sulfonate/bicarbonate transport system substrate-binding protein
VFDYDPQHQSTCGLCFNDPVVAGGKTFGPREWAGDLFVAGYSRGKLYRTKLAKTDTGYVASNDLIASTNMLLADACVTADGGLVLPCHSGGPDWGTGPSGKGKLYKVTYAEPDRPRPLFAWPATPGEIHVAFDRPVDPEMLRDNVRQTKVTQGRYVRVQLAGRNNLQLAEVQVWGMPGGPVTVVVGYQPYYTQSWSGVVMRGKKFYEKYLPKGSNVEFQTGLQGAIIVTIMLAGKQHIGFLGDTSSIVATTRTEVADVRLVANLGLAYDQCNTFLVRNDAPQFKNDQEAIRWLGGKTVAVPKGSCTDRCAQAAFKRFNIQPKEYLNQDIEVITSNFRAGKLDAAVMWEPTTSRLVDEGLARVIATGRSVQETGGAFLAMRADLIKQRPDVVKAWLQAELDGQLFKAPIAQVKALPAAQAPK